MSRIRSVHPGFFRDDHLVPCSAFARLLFIGLGVEADDKGIFEWKPITLKMSIFPGDNVDVPELLAELIEADAIRQYEVGGKRYGAIRNFRKFQKPKTPNDVHPMADGVAEYVSLPQKEETGDGKRHSFPTKGEKSFQMEDGGGKRDGGSEPPLPPEGSEEKFRIKVWEVAPRHPAGMYQDAKQAFDALSTEDQDACIQGVRELRASFDNFQQQTGKAPTPTTLHKWIGKRGWEGFGGSTSGELVVVEAGTADFSAIQRIRGKPISVGGSGKITVKRSELDAALRQTA